MKSWAVHAVVFIGLGMLCQVGAQTTSAEIVAEDDEYYIEWIMPETPPYPPVFQDGKWLTWEEAFGPLLARTYRHQASQESQAARTLRSERPMAREKARACAPIIC